jgi:TPR repeat protein
VRRDADEGRRWIIRAALNGSARAKQDANFTKATPDQLREGEDLNRVQRAQSGDAQAQFELGQSYLQQKQFAWAKQWLEKAAAQGYEPARAALQTLDAEAAIKPVAPPTEAPIPQDLLARAQAGDATAQFLLGMLYFNRKDTANAKLWLQKAADQGIVLAQDRLKDLEGSAAAPHTPSSFCPWCKQ